MAQSAVTRMKVGLFQVDKPPQGGIKWKALFDNDNPVTNKLLFRNTHTSELMSWNGFVRQYGKDYLYTCIPHTNEQHTIIKHIEDQVEALLSQHEWSRSFKLTPTQKIYPKYDSCIFYEKKDDGKLHRVTPDIENELHNTPEKSLTIGAVLQAAGVFFDFATHAAKLTFKLVTATYAWSESGIQCEEVLTNYLSAFGAIATAPAAAAAAVSAPPPPPPLQQASGMDIVEAAVSVSGIATTATAAAPPPSQVVEAPLDKESFLASLSKLRTVNGIHRRMRQLQKRHMDAGMREWCEQEARRVMFELSAKTTEKKRRKAEEDEETAVTTKKVKPLTLQRQNNGVEQQQFKVVLEQSNDSLGHILSTDDEEGEEEEEEEDMD